MYLINIIIFFIWNIFVACIEFTFHTNSNMIIMGFFLYISNGLRNAKHANDLSDGLSKHNDIEIAYPTEANKYLQNFQGW